MGSRRSTGGVGASVVPLPHEEPHRLSDAQAKRFLRSLAEKPFVALVLDDDETLHIYAKGVDDGTLARIRDLLDDQLA